MSQTPTNPNMQKLVAAFMEIPDAGKAQAFVDFVATVVISNQNPRGFFDALASIVAKHIAKRAA